MALSYRVLGGKKAGKWQGKWVFAKKHRFSLPNTQNSYIMEAAIPGGGPAGRKEDTI
jgi:hypothetical protein